MMATTDRPYRPSDAHPALARARRFEQLLEQDPTNALLLADTADAAIAAGEFESADAFIRSGLALQPNEPGWVFRQATLRIAQRDLVAARELLTGLQQASGPHPVIAHNLAYIDFLSGDFNSAAAALKPWLDQPQTQEDATQSLWLRAMHHLGSLDEAWAFVQARAKAGSLGAGAAGVASLIALDRSDLAAAQQLSQQSVDAGAAQVEAFVARASCALAAGDTALAKQLLQRALQLSPRDGRSWSSLGFALSIEQDFAGARQAFDTAVASMPQHTESWQGLGWACVMLNDLPAAAIAFDAALALDEANAESHGGRAVVHALQREHQAARAHIDRATGLDNANVSAQLAQRILSGEITGPKDLQLPRRS